MYLLHSFILLLCGVTYGQNVDTPPVITSPFDDAYYIPELNDFNKTFHCQATGHPEITFEWRKDGKKVVNSLVTRVDPVNGYLSIFKAELSDFGVYQCFASNTVGTAMSAAFTLERAFMPPFSDIVQKTLDPVQQYRNMSIPCTGKPKCRPASDCRYEWKLGAGASNTVEQSDRIAVDMEGTLHFLNVDLTDQSTQSDPYACGVWNEQMKALYKGANIIMSVIPVTNPAIYPPKALFFRDTRGLLGGEAELQCVFAGYPLPDMGWQAPNGQMISEIKGKYEFRANTARRNLIIKNLKASDEGTYKCIASNIQGKVQAQVFLNVTSKPRFAQNELLLSAVVPQGKDANFTCKMVSMDNERPPTSPIWRRNGMLLPASQIGDRPEQKYRLSEDGTVLTIKNVQKPSDACSIMCSSGNVIYDMNGNDKFVETYADASLRVIDAIGVNVLTPTSLELKDTGAFSMAVTTTKDESTPQLFYTWTLTRPDGTKLSDTDLQNPNVAPYASFNNRHTNLTINPELAEGDNEAEKVRNVVGIYKLRIWHEYESVEKDFDIFTELVVATKAPIVVQRASIPLWIIGVVLGIIVLLIVIFFIICTLYRNRGGEYPVDKKEVAAGHDPERELKDSGFSDLSRADGEKMPFDKVSLTDEVKPLESDEDSMTEDYDDDADMTKFNEDGSFIGIYMDKKGQDQTPVHQTQSTV